MSNSRIIRLLWEEFTFLYCTQVINIKVDSSPLHGLPIMLPLFITSVYLFLCYVFMVASQLCWRLLYFGSVKFMPFTANLVFGSWRSAKLGKCGGYGKDCIFYRPKNGLTDMFMWIGTFSCCRHFFLVFETTVTIKRTAIQFFRNHSCHYIFDWIVQPPRWSSALFFTINFCSGLRIFFR